MRDHPLAVSARSTFDAARDGLAEALAYYNKSNDTRHTRVALAGIAAACDALKATANAYANVIGQVHRAGQASAD